MEYFYIGGVLFFVLTPIAIASYWFIQWLYGGGNGRPRS